MIRQSTAFKGSMSWNLFPFMELAWLLEGVFNGRSDSQEKRGRYIKVNHSLFESCVCGQPVWTLAKDSRLSTGLSGQANHGVLHTRGSGNTQCVIRWKVQWAIQCRAFPRVPSILAPAESSINSSKVSHA